MQNSKDASQTLKLPQTLKLALHALSQREETTLFITLLAAFQVLLMRYSGQEEIIIGTSLPHRTQSDENMLVLRTDLSNNPSFQQLLQRVRDVILDSSYMSPELFFEQLVEEFQVAQAQRHLSLSPAFFALQDTQPLLSDQIEICWEPVKGKSQIVQFALALQLWQQDDGLQMVVIYNADRFEAEMILLLMKRYHALLENLVSDPVQQIWEVPILNIVEQQILEEWNATDAACPMDLVFPTLFESQVEQSPSLPAILSGGQPLTYVELNKQVNQLANYLKQLEVGPGVRVGLCLDRSSLMIVGLLAILKAGAACVPLDSSYPTNRLQFMLQDSEAQLIISQVTLIQQLALDFPPERIICLDQKGEDISRQSSKNPAPPARIGDLAYILYTSGSIGQPKGVAISHGSLGQYIYSIRKPLGVCSTDRYLHTASLSFSAAVRQSLLPLSTGACLIIADFEQRSDPLLLFDLMKKAYVTVWDTVPTFWQHCISTLLLQTEQYRTVALQNSVRLILTTGEPLEWELPKIWRYQFKHPAHCINLYSQTETTGTVCSYHVDANCADKKGMVPLGRPVENVKIYLLDEFLLPVPFGISGEIYIATQRLFEGYLHNPDLNTKKIIHSPFSYQKSEKLYKTGDRACYLTAETIVPVGRSDRRIKIRGFRVEPGEIENVLGQHPAVQKVLVAIQETTSGTKRLVAYIVADTSDIVSSILLRELQSLLKLKLPDYMQPSAFQLLETFPLTPNGKIDYRAMTMHETSFLDAGEEFVAPRNELETTIASIWVQVLHLSQVSVYDNFFACGGDSLIATQVITRLARALQVTLPLRVFFEAPTIAQLAEYVLLAKAQEVTQSLPDIPVISHFDTMMPLSFQQERLWFLHQLHQANSAYNMNATLRLLGQLDVEALERSINVVAKRHTILHARFISVEGLPKQVIEPHMHFSLSKLDISHLSPDKQEEQIVQHLQKAVQKFFDLEHGPLFHTTLIHLGEQEHILNCTMHHIIADGWSKRILWQETSVAYNDYIHHQPMQLPKIPLQYTDFASWQQGIAISFQEKHLAYWKEQLCDLKPVLDLPTDRSRLAIQSFRGSMQTLEIPKTLTNMLKALSKSKGVSLYITLLAAWKTLLYRYSDQTDIAIGTPIANRTRPELEQLLGFFANTLVLRTDLSGNPRFTELLSRVQEVAFAAHTHQDMPFEKLVEALQPERSLSYQPLFQIMFAFQNSPLEGVDLSGLITQPIDVDSGAAKFDLSLFLNESATGVKGYIEFSTDLFDIATVQRMVAHYLTLLQSIVEAPSQCLNELTFLPADEKHLLLVTWNSTKKNYPLSHCLHHLFEAQALYNPEKDAVIFGLQTITYRQLNERANQLAHYLQHLGVCPEMRIGICMERSIDLIVCLLGVLKAGAAYVPLDPMYPEKRLHFMLEDSKATFLLSQQQVSERLHLPDEKLVCLDRDWPAITECSTDNPMSDVQPNNLAYVLYTSGSTGQPKGVAIEHHSPVTLIHWARELYTDEELAGVLAATSLCFDLSIFELFVPLSWGGRVILVESILSLPKLISVYNVYLINTVPSAIAELLHLGSIPASVLTLNLAGEPIPPKLVKQVYEQTSIQKVYNLYGPTEDCTYSTYALLTKGLTEIQPIGRPIANTQVYVLDVNQQPVPIGLPGELYIGGDGLAREYLGRPELSRQKFIAHPFCTDSYARLYRTGDLVRYRPDGQLEFIGRLDHQIKLRGFRIELGEIEAVIRQHSTIQDCIVILREDTPGMQQIVAYVVVNQRSVSTVNDLRSYVEKVLPNYMVPSLFVLLESLPLTLNGKVNHRALPAPDRSERKATKPFVAPHNLLEVQLSTIWEDILGISIISVNDNFFEIGGHSLLAVRLLSRVYQLFGQYLPLTTLFQGGTIENMARILREEIKMEVYTPLTVINHGTLKRPLYTLHSSGGHVMRFANLAKLLDSDQPVYGLQSAGLEGEREPFTTIEDMAAYYAQAIQDFQPEGPYLLCGYCLGGFVAFETARKLQSKSREVALLALIDVAPPDKVFAPMDDASYWKWKLNNLQGHIPPAFIEMLEQMDPERMLEYMEKYLPFISNMDVIKDTSLQEFLKNPNLVNMLKVEKNNIQALSRYQPGHYTGPVMFFNIPGKYPGYERDLGWSKLIDGPIKIYEIPSPVKTVMDNPVIEVVADVLKKSLT